MRVRTARRDDLAERLSLIMVDKVLAGTPVYRERARQLYKMAEAEIDPTLRGNLLMLAARYSELGMTSSSNP